MNSHFQPAPNPSIAQSQAAPLAGRANVVVIGNEKGGSGKSTTALHIAVALLGGGARVSTLDLDARQATLGRYLENRAAYAKSKGASDLMVPAEVVVLDKLPVLGTGKIDMVGVAKFVKERAAAAPSAPAEQTAVA